MLKAVKLTEFAYCLRLRIRLLEHFAPGVVQARAELLVPGVGQARATFFFPRFRLPNEGEKRFHNSEIFHVASTDGNSLSRCVLETSIEYSH